VLGLASVSAEKFTLRSKFQLFEGVAWTVPTLVGSRLYARDRKRVVALELGP
jgi:hypothetical protein